MGMTMTEKILARHAGRDSVSAGDLLGLTKIKSLWCRTIFRPARILRRQRCAKPCAILRARTILKTILKLAAWALNIPCCRTAGLLRHGH